MVPYAETVSVFLKQILHCFRFSSDARGSSSISIQKRARDGGDPLSSDSSCFRDSIRTAYIIWQEWGQSLFIRPVLSPFHHIYVTVLSSSRHFEWDRYNICLYYSYCRVTQCLAPTIQCIYTYFHPVPNDVTARGLHWEPHKPTRVVSKRIWSLWTFILFIGLKPFISRKWKKHNRAVCGGERNALLMRIWRQVRKETRIRHRK